MTMKSREFVLATIIWVGMIMYGYTLGNFRNIASRLSEIEARLARGIWAEHAPPLLFTKDGALICKVTQ